MNRRIAQFEKVSFDQWVTDMKTHQPDCCSDKSQLKYLYDIIQLPTRATRGSSGYDFRAPFPFSLEAGESIVIPTGIRCWINDEWWLMCMPKSGQGFKYRVQLDNTVGNIDSDYYGSEKNEGHIIAKLTNDGREGKKMEVMRGDGYMQGVFTVYGITIDDEADGIRNGGFGSTGK